MQNELTAERTEQAIRWVENRLNAGLLPGAASMMRICLAALRDVQEREKNEPLTWKDLAYMDGEPIWSEILEGDDASAWEIFFADNYDESEYGVLWLAYLYGRPAKTQEGENDGTSNK